MRVLSYNILDGGIGRADPIAEVIEAQRADVVVLLEADELTIVERIAHRLGMDRVVAANGSHVAAILSRLPIIDSVNHGPLRPEIDNSFVKATILSPNREPWGIYAIHLHPFGRLTDEQVRLRQIDTILDVARPMREEHRPHLLCGDFNATSPSQVIERERLKPRSQEEMDDNGGMLPRKAIARIVQAGYCDTLEMRHGAAAGRMGTFNTLSPGQRVDYIFCHSLDPYRITDAWIETDRLATYASDHYPVGVEMGLKVD